MSTNTSWYPSVRHTPRKWVLTNGSVIEEPSLEESSSGRRVRLAGEKKTYATADASKVAFTGALALALKADQRILTEFYSTTDGAHPFFHSPRAEPNLHILENPSSAKWTPSSRTTTYWWRFVNHDVPQIQALVQIQVADQGNYYDRTSGAKRIITTNMVTTRVVPNSAANAASVAEGLYGPPPSEVDHYFDSVGQGNHTGEFKEWLRAHDWPGRALMLAENIDQEDAFWPFIDPDDEVVTKNDDKRALKEILRRIRQWDGVESFCAPNFAKVAFPDQTKNQPTVWQLHLAGTNVNNDVIDSLIALIEGHDAVNEALEHFAAMQKALRGIGLVLGDVRGTDLLKLLSNTSERFSAEVETVIYTADSKATVEEAGGVRANLPVDHNSHHLSVDLLSGNFVLSCSRRAMDNETLLNMAASQWEEAKTMASITGEESELLAFARAVARREQTAAHAAAVAASK